MQPPVKKDQTFKGYKPGYNKSGPINITTTVKKSGLPPRASGWNTNTKYNGTGKNQATVITKKKTVIPNMSQTGGRRAY